MVSGVGVIIGGIVLTCIVDYIFELVKEARNK